MKKIIVFIVLSTLIFGCIGHKAMKYPEKYLNADAFPSDIKKDGYILLVQKQETSRMVSNVQNGRVDKLMKRFYDKPYEMVSYTDVTSNSKYANKNVYRYLLKQSGAQGEQVITKEPGMGSLHFTYREVFITDRLLGKDFPGTGQSLDSYEADMRVVAPYLGKMK